MTGDAGEKMCRKKNSLTDKKILNITFTVTVCSKNVHLKSGFRLFLETVLNLIDQRRAYEERERGIVSRCVEYNCPIKDCTLYLSACINSKTSKLFVISIEFKLQFY